MMIRGVFCFMIMGIFGPVPLTGQTPNNEGVTILFQPIFQETPLEIVEKDFGSNKDSISIEIFKCYISNIKFYHDDQLVFSEPDSYHLLNTEDLESLSLNVKVPKETIFNHLVFKIGIDSLTNSQGALEGDLDPVHGMYWTWQSGYINFKLEGQAKESPARNQAYQYHVGGFLDGNEACPSVRLAIKNSLLIQIGIDLDVFFNRLKMATQYRIMSPGPEAVELANLLAAQFFVR